jgi:hypothetical protein
MWLQWQAAEEAGWIESDHPDRRLGLQDPLPSYACGACPQALKSAMQLALLHADDLIGN